MGIPQRTRFIPSLNYFRCDSCSPNQKVPALIRTQSGASKCVQALLPSPLLSGNCTDESQIWDSFSDSIPTCLSAQWAYLDLFLFPQTHIIIPLNPGLASVCNFNGIAILTVTQTQNLSLTFDFLLYPPFSSLPNSVDSCGFSWNYPLSCILRFLRWRPRLLV